MKDLQVETNWLLAMFFRILHFTRTQNPQDKQLVLTLKEALSMLELSIDHLHKLSTQRVEPREKTENMVRYNIQWMNFALESIGQKIDTPQDLTNRVHTLIHETTDLLDSVCRELPGIEDGFNQLNERITDNLSDFMGTNPVPGRSDVMLLGN